MSISISPLQFVALSTLLVVANAGLLPVQQTLLQTGQVAYAAPSHTLHQLEEHSPAQYDFSYSVNDPHTGDIKEQHESRQGDNVQGQYSLVEPDGQRRTVQYTADAVNGFNAVVLRDGVSQHATQLAPIAAVSSLPTVTLAHRSAPLATISHASPIAYTQHAAPITTYATQQHLVAPLAYTQKIATPVTTYHAAQPQIAYTSHQATPIAYTSHQATPIAYAQHPAPLAYTQTHHVAAAPAVAYTQHHAIAAPALAYTSAAGHSHASVSLNGAGLSYSY